MSIRYTELEVFTIVQREGKLRNYQRSHSLFTANSLTKRIPEDSQLKAQTLGPWKLVQSSKSWRGVTAKEFLTN